MKAIKTRAEWKEHVDNFNKSGLSINKYSKDNCLKPTTFRYWVGKFSEKIESNNLVKISPVNFSSSKKIKLTCSEITVEIPCNIDSLKITKIISILFSASRNSPFLQ